MPSRKTTKKNVQQYSLFDLVAEKESARDEIRGMLQVMKNLENKGSSWRGLLAVPPGSLLSAVVSAFEKQTDIPLEIPFFVTLHLLSADLLKRKVTIDFQGQIIRPDLWTVVLAESGAGKTFTANRLMDMTGAEDTFPDPATAARFIEELQSHNNSLWIRDEFGQFLKTLETQSYAQEIKDILLRTYDGKEVARRTKKYEIVVKDPALTILGLTVYSTFLDIITPDSLLDGFAQRFSYVIAKKDPKRPMRKFPWYNFQAWEGTIRREWDTVATFFPDNGAQYHVTELGVEGFNESFDMLVHDQLPDSFYRRIMVRGIRYALLYHLLLKKDSLELDQQDMGWAGRLSALHIQDAVGILGTQISEMGRLIQKAEVLRDRLAAEGKPLKARDLVMNIRGIRNASDARFILSELGPPIPKS
jgi:hypothetical protein